MRLSEHFNLDEFIFSETAIRRKIDNTPPPAVIENLEKLCQLILEPTRILLGGRPLTIMSGYRCLELNTAIGSQPTSHHVLGGAADFVCPAFGSPYQIALLLSKSGIPFGQLIHEFKSWVHLSILSVSKPENRIITIDHDHPSGISGII